MRITSDKKKTKGLIAITVYHLIAAVVFFVIDSGGLNNLNLTDVAKGLISAAILLVMAIISFVITLVLKKRNELKPIWVILNLGITFIHFFGIGLLAVEAPQFVEQNKKIIDLILSSPFRDILYYVLLYITSFASLKGYMKKKPKDPYAWLHEDIVVDKKIHEYIYDEFGNFGD